MSARVRAVICVIVVLVTVACCVAWMRHVPEPRYKGVGLGQYLRENPRNSQLFREGREAVRELGASAVPYLMSEIEKNPVIEFLLRIGPSMPAKVASIFPNRYDYLNTRSRAAGFLPEAGTNAIKVLPRLLEMAEAEHPNYTHNLIRAIGMLAPGTVHQDRARTLMIEVVKASKNNRSESELERMSYHFLGAFGGSEVVRPLIDGLQRPNMVDACIEALKRLGTNAVPDLKKVAEAEAGHIRPATLALEKIEAKVSADSQR
jgi:hypothetical protein